MSELKEKFYIYLPDSAYPRRNVIPNYYSFEYSLADISAVYSLGGIFHFSEVERNVLRVRAFAVQGGDYTLYLIICWICRFMVITNKIQKYNTRIG